MDSKTPTQQELWSAERGVCAPSFCLTLRGKLLKGPGGCPAGCAPVGPAMPVSVAQAGSACSLGCASSYWSSVGFPFLVRDALDLPVLVRAPLTMTLKKAGPSSCPWGRPLLVGIWAVSQKSARGTGSAAPRERTDHTSECRNVSSPGNIQTQLYGWVDNK